MRMQVYFRSDGSQTRTGFSAKWSIVGSESQSNMQPLEEGSEIQGVRVLFGGHLGPDQALMMLRLPELAAVPAIGPLQLTIGSSARLQSFELNTTFECENTEMPVLMYQFPHRAYTEDNVTIRLGIKHLNATIDTIRFLHTNTAKTR